mmetsp:Transcript_16671/g.36338  ORF Transcript_16671/g.36338 Transcript_16671/m.36338 type:complete len:429 (-) Transcript_16671:164-1450(-)
MVRCGCSSFGTLRFPSRRFLFLAIAIASASIVCSMTRTSRTTSTGCTSTTTIGVVSAWGLGPISSRLYGRQQQRWAFLRVDSHPRRTATATGRTPSFRLQLYNKEGRMGGTRTNQRNARTKGNSMQMQQRNTKRNQFSNNTSTRNTDLYYNTNNTTDQEGVVSNVEQVVATKNNANANNNVSARGKGPVPTATAAATTAAPPTNTLVSTGGSMGDIMSPTIDDADLLFRDGLVTSERNSLEDTYGISNPLDRMAVTANGNLQRLFSSYYDAPVVVEMVYSKRRQQQSRELLRPNNIDNNSTTAATTTTTTILRNSNNDGNDRPAVWDRQGLLKIFGNQTFCTADSVIVVHSREVEDLVESGRVGIGQIFRHFNILPEFTLLAVGHTTNGKADTIGAGFWRNYTLESDLVTCSIHEVFCEGVWELKKNE